MSDRILVTGGHGFLGQAVCRVLSDRGYRDVITFRSSEFDLRDPGQAKKLMQTTRPRLVVHLAATVGGIGANMKNPGRFFYENAVMGIHLMEEARLAGVGKFLTAGTVCSYPKLTPIPFREEELWNGYPEETNASYGLAKKMLLVQGQAYRQQYGFNAVYLVPVNLYGPEDNFDPASSHVIPALITKFIDAMESGKDRVVVWGTGSASREFLYIDDAAEAVVLALEKYDEPDPVNIGSSMEITIKELTDLIAELLGFEGSIEWDTSKPDGQPRRKLDVGKAEKALGFRSVTDFRSGLLKTIQWYREVRLASPREHR